MKIVLPKLPKLPTITTLNKDQIEALITTIAVRGSVIIGVFFFFYLVISIGIQFGFLPAFFIGWVLFIFSWIMYKIWKDLCC